MTEFGFGTEFPGSKKERMKHSCVVLVFRIQGGRPPTPHPPPPKRNKAYPEKVKRIVTSGFYVFIFKGQWMIKYIGFLNILIQLSDRYHIIFLFVFVICLLKDKIISFFGCSQLWSGEGPTWHVVFTLPVTLLGRTESCESGASSDHPI